MSESKGFVTGRGQAVAPPSESAIQKALKILSAVEEESDQMVSQATPSAPPRPVAGFTTGHGNAVAGPSRLALNTVPRLFDQLDPPKNANGGLPSLDQLSTPVKTPAKPILDQDKARRKAMSIFGEDDLGTPTATRGSMLPPVASTPFRPLVATTSMPRPATSTAAPLPPITSTAFRTPLRLTTNTFTQTPSSLPKTALKQIAPIQIKTPTSSKRINVGLTPTRNRTKKTFVTPFKEGSKLAGSPLGKGPATPRTSFVPTSSSLQEVKNPVVSIPVFDLASKLPLSRDHIRPS